MITYAQCRNRLGTWQTNGLRCKGSRWRVLILSPSAPVLRSLCTEALKFLRSESLGTRAPKSTGTARLRSLFPTQPGIQLSLHQKKFGDRFRKPLRTVKAQTASSGLLAQNTTTPQPRWTRYRISSPFRRRFKSR